MARVLMLVMAVVLIAGVSNARGDDTEEVKRLKKQVEDLQSKLKDASLKVEKLEAENMQLKTDAKLATAKAADDAFALGTIFVGERRIIYGKGLPDYRQKVKLEITSRDKTSFEGQLTITNVTDEGIREVKVTGTAPTGKDGVVRFKTEKSGKFQNSFTGRYGSGEIGFDFGGTGHEGQPISGKGTMAAK